MDFGVRVSERAFRMSSASGVKQRKWREMATSFELRLIREGACSSTYSSNISWHFSFLFASSSCWENSLTFHEMHYQQKIGTAITKSTFSSPWNFFTNALNSFKSSKLLKIFSQVKRGVGWGISCGVFIFSPSAATVSDEPSERDHLEVFVLRINEYEKSCKDIRWNIPHVLNCELQDLGFVYFDNVQG